MDVKKKKKTLKDNPRNGMELYFPTHVLAPTNCYFLKEECTHYTNHAISSFVTSTEEGRRFCRNMYAKLKTVALFLKMFKKFTVMCVIFFFSFPAGMFRRSSSPILSLSALGDRGFLASASKYSQLRGTSVYIKPEARLSLLYSL